MSYEYEMEVLDEPPTPAFLQNEYGIHGYKMIGIVEYEDQYYCYFERSS